MKLSIFILVLLLALFSSANGSIHAEPQHAGTSRWSGTYEFEEALPGQVMQYLLTISKDNKARLKIDGFQTLVRADADAQIAGSKCSIIFKSNYDDKDVSVKIPSKFKPGDLIFSLEKRHGKLITIWGEQGPLVLNHQKPGMYFQRTK
jgi:hypothetical protein